MYSTWPTKNDKTETAPIGGDVQQYLEDELECGGREPVDRKSDTKGYKVQ